MLLACWTPPGPELVLLLCWPQQPGQPSRLHPRPGAVTSARAPARGPKTGCRRHPLPCRPSRFTPAARPGMTHRDGQSMRRRIKSTHIAEYLLLFALGRPRRVEHRSASSERSPGPGFTGVHPQEVQPSVRQPVTTARVAAGGPAVTITPARVRPRACRPGLRRGTATVAPQGSCLCRRSGLSGCHRRGLPEDRTARRRLPARQGRPCRGA